MYHKVKIVGKLLCNSVNVNLKEKTETILEHRIKYFKNLHLHLG